MALLKHAGVTDQIHKAFYAVYNELGYGFNEKVYENALVVELTRLGLKAVPQCEILVYFREHEVGKYIADVVVNDCVICELKSASDISDEHLAQLLNYLKATHYEVGLLLNFGKEPKTKRKSYDNDRKGSLSWTRRTTP